MIVQVWLAQSVLLFIGHSNFKLRLVLYESYSAVIYGKLRFLVLCVGFSSESVNKSMHIVSALMARCHT